MGKIFIPITSPIETKKTINMAINFARITGFKVFVVGFIDNESIAKLERYRLFISEESELFKDDMKKNAEKYLNYAKRVGVRNSIDVETELIIGEPYSSFVEFFLKDPEENKLICISKSKDYNIEDLKTNIFGVIETKLLKTIKTDFLISGGDHGKKDDV